MKKRRPTKKELRKYMVIPEHIICKPDNSRTPNEFGFQKLCFPLKYFDVKSNVIDTKGFESSTPEKIIMDSVKLQTEEKSNDSKIEKDESLQEQLEKLAEQVKKETFPLDFFNVNSDFVEKTDFEKPVQENRTKDSDELFKGSKNSIDSKVEKEKTKEGSLQDEIEKLVEQVKKVEETTKDTKLNTYETWQKAYGSNTTATNIYAQHTSKYKEYMSSYINSNENDVAAQNYSGMAGEGKPMKQGDEVMDFNERKEYAKNVMMNARYGNRTMPHSSSTDKQKYELWKASSKFNQLLSFVMYDSLQMVQ